MGVKGLWRVRVMVVADQTMMRHYNNEENVLLMYIKTLMAEVASIFRYGFSLLIRGTGDILRPFVYHE